MNPIKRTYKPRVYHLDIEKGGEPIVFAPLNRFLVPDNNLPGLSLLSLEKSSDVKKIFQLNYRGGLKPYSIGLIKRQVSKERESKAYHNLDETIRALRPQLLLNQPMEIIEDSDLLVFYNPDEEGLPMHDFSLVSFGVRYPHQSAGAKLQIRYAGDYSVARFTDLSQLPEIYNFLIRNGANEIDDSLRRRFDQFQRNGIPDRRTNTQNGINDSKERNGGGK